MDQKQNFTSLLNDASFINWIKRNPSSTEWESFKKEHAISDENLELARQIIQQVARPIDNVSTEIIKDQVWNEIESKTKPSKQTAWFIILGILALVILTLTVSYFYSNSSGTSTDIVVDTSDQWVEYTNTTSSNSVSYTHLTLPTICSV